jgi:hypothetical protein
MIMSTGVWSGTCHSPRAQSPMHPPVRPAGIRKSSQSGLCILWKALLTRPRLLSASLRAWHSEEAVVLELGRRILGRIDIYGCLRKHGDRSPCMASISGLLLSQSKKKLFQPKLAGPLRYSARQCCSTHMELSRKHPRAALCSSMVCRGLGVFIAGVCEPMALK